MIKNLPEPFFFFLSFFAFLSVCLKKRNSLLQKLIYENVYTNYTLQSICYNHHYYHYDYVYYYI